jgi:hypothetical protein
VAMCSSCTVASTCQSRGLLRSRRRSSASAHPECPPGHVLYGGGCDVAELGYLLETPNFENHQPVASVASVQR